MRKLFIILCLLCSISATAQNQDNYNLDPRDPNAPTKIRLQAQSASIESYLNQEKYDEALSHLKLQYDFMMKNNMSPSEASCLQNLVLQARCYHRTQQYDSAISTASKVAEITKTDLGENSLEYAQLLDNLSVYQMEAKQITQALDNAKKSTAIYEQQNQLTDDYAVALYHLADAYLANGNNHDALAAQEKAVTMIGAIKGETSSLYLQEIPRLRKLYELNGMQDKVDMLDMKIALMKKNGEEVDVVQIEVPEPDFETAEEANVHVAEAKACAEYIISHYLTSPQMAKAAIYLTQWAAVSDLVTVDISPITTQVDLRDGNVQFFLIVYTAGIVRYAIDHHETKMSYPMYASAVVDVLNSYYRHKEMKLVKNISYFNLLIKADLNHHLDKYLQKAYKD